jgi:hypothetical protein
VRPVDRGLIDARALQVEDHAVADCRPCHLLDGALVVARIGHAGPSGVRELARSIRNGLSPRYSAPRDKERVVDARPRLVVQHNGALLHHLHRRQN